MALPTPREPQPLPATRSRALITLWNPDSNGEHFARVITTDPDLPPKNRTRHRVRESVQVRVKGERLEQAEALRG